MTRYVLFRRAYDTPPVVLEGVGRLPWAHGTLRVRLQEFIHMVDTSEGDIEIVAIKNA